MSSHDFYSEVPPQNYANYGAPPPRKTNWGLWGVLGILGGGCFFIFFCCCCCLVLILAAIQTPVGVVSFWAGTLQNSGAYDAANLVVCSNSQAATYMTQLEADGGYFQGTTNTIDLGNSQAEVSGTLVRNSRPDSNWSAVLTVQSSGGTFGTCISEIQER